MPRQARAEETEATEPKPGFAEKVAAERGQRSGSNEIEHIRVGSAVASIFTNQGENGPYDTVQFQKAYKKDGKTEYSNSFSGGDLLELAKCADKAHDRVMERRRERYEDRSQGQSR